MRCGQMDEKTLKEIYEFLELDLLEKLEYPCESCSLCGASKYKHDMALHIEFEQKEKRIESVRLCRRCNAKYLRRKKAIHMGYRKM
jgi:hypothetical protein